MPTNTKRKLLPFTALLFALALTACPGALTSPEASWPPSAGEVLIRAAASQFPLPMYLPRGASFSSYAGERNVVLVFYRGFW